MPRTRKKNWTYQSPSKLMLIPLSTVADRILIIRGRKVLLDEHLASLYGVTTKRLNEAVRRNRQRFPTDFMFQLTSAEHTHLRTQFATSKFRGGRRYAPYAFTEHGAVMLAAVLNSPLAVQASILVVRAFVRLRRVLGSTEHLRTQLDSLEAKVKKHDEHFSYVFDALRALMDESEEEADTKPRIGYHTETAPRKSS